MKEPPAARDTILTRLRQALDVNQTPFRADNRRTPLPDPPTPVTSADGDPAALARKFGKNLERVDGSYEIVDRAADVAEHVSRLTHQWSGDDSDHEILSWAPEHLPVPGIASHLRASAVELSVPDDLHDAQLRARAAAVLVGLTGVEAAIATTGSVLLASGAGRSRAASLLPLHHIVLVPMSRIYPTVEAWLGEVRRDGDLSRLLSHSAQLVFVTGPSKSADIELNLTLGVHGPRVVHAVVFDDRDVRGAQATCTRNE